MQTTSQNVNLSVIVTELVMPSYEVLYVDKFADPAHSHSVMQKLEHLFQLNPKTQQRLTSGMPVVIKKHIDRIMAERFHHIITSAGGTGWVQELSPFGFHVERRYGTRRNLIARRAARRESSIQPDRRLKKERRVSIH